MLPKEVKYLTSVKDEYLVHELERANVKVQVKKPKLPNRELALVDNKAVRIEQQALLGISCSVTQSWMLQFLTSKLDKITKYCQQEMEPDQFHNFLTNCDLTSTQEVAVLAQDACLDMLDLQARQAAEAKWVRRSLWIDQTRWAPSIKTAVKRFPTVGDGSLCGPNLKDKLESYRLTSKALDVTASFTAPKRPNPQTYKRGRQDSNTGPQAKRPNQSFGDKNVGVPKWTRPTGRGRGTGAGNTRAPLRTQNRPSTSDNVNSSG